ncbi:inorganic diphosphatase [Deinococcus sp. QL22]|uniref:inorganic diphosphatase n=1 Tax=Deinococcus sp. QL22 TaxID=2939437 RepID=UPI002017B833|nr:inorganic diphosphatase [Deinococcus sp. QL22]UQN10609.1 hypothetical protein M1R55_30915 [Deinococcus sp. QL22]
MTDVQALHPQHPNWVFAVIEQPRHEPFRVQYDPLRGVFEHTTWRSLPYARAFPGHYGWIRGTGHPPDVHFDVYVVDDQSITPGDVLEAALIGMFVRSDGDHKFFAITGVPLGEEPDLLTLLDEERHRLMAVYPQLGDGDAWLGRDAAREWLRTRLPEHV